MTAASRCALGLTALLIATVATPASAAHINEVTISGSINPASSDYVQKAIAKSEADGAVAVLINLDTPGGLLSSTKDIIIKSANKVTIEATTVEIVADVTITGKLTVSDDVIVGTISLKDHLHSGVTSGAQSSGPPVP